MKSLDQKKEQSYQIQKHYFAKGKKFKDQFYFTLLKYIFSKSSTLNMIGTHLNENFENFKFKINLFNFFIIVKSLSFSDNEILYPFFLHKLLIK